MQTMAPLPSSSQVHLSSQWGKELRNSEAKQIMHFVPIIFPADTIFPPSIVSELIILQSY